MSPKQHLPKQLHPLEFLSSIRLLPLRNPLIPEFDEDADQLIHQLAMKNTSAVTIGEVFDVADRELTPGDATEFLPPLLQQIIFKYGFSLGWQVVVKIEPGGKHLILPQSLFESEHLRICRRFSVAKYDALDMTIVRIERMDLSDEIGPIDFDRRGLSKEQITESLDREPDPRIAALKKRSLKLMRRNGDLSGNVRTISPDLRKVIFQRRQPLFAGRQRLGGFIPRIVRGSPPSKGEHHLKSKSFKERFLRFCLMVTSVNRRR